MGSIQVKIDDLEFAGVAGIRSEQDKISLVHTLLAEKRQSEHVEIANSRRNAYRNKQGAMLEHENVEQELDAKFL